MILRILFVFFLFCFPVFAGNLMYLVGGGGSAPWSGLLEETWNGATDCGDGTHSNCNNTWSYWSSWPNFVATAAGTPLAGDGTYCLSMSAIEQEIYHSFTPADTIYASVPVSNSALQDPNFLQIRDASDNILCNIWTYGYGADSFVVSNTGGTDRSSADHAFAVNTKYYLKIKAVKGTGANAQCQGYYSTNGSTWTTITNSTNGTWTNQPAKVYLKGQDSSTNLRGRVRVSTNDINY